MNLLNSITKEKLNGIIERVNKNDIKDIKKSNDFTFDWNIEQVNQLYKLSLIESKEILGIISLIDYPNEFRIHINLLESSKKQRGKKKSILNIPGCLIAFACKMSFKNGYDGFVSLIPKTELIDYYLKTYGFLHFGNQMAVFQENSELIILKFFGDEKI